MNRNILGPLSALLIVSPALGWGQTRKETAYQFVSMSGDGIVVSKGKDVQNVEFIGVHFPRETKPEVKTFLRKTLEGKTVRLERDPKFPQVKLAPIPAYVFAGNNDISINEQLIAAGLAQVDTDHPGRMGDQFQAAQDKARDAQVGLWKEQPVEVRPQVEWVPDPSYVPKAGDRAQIHAPEDGDAFGASDAISYSMLAKAVKAEDSEGLKELAQKGRIALVRSGLNVLVIESHDNFLTGDLPAVELRLMEGTGKNKVLWVPSFYVARMVPKTKPTLENGKTIPGKTRQRR